MNVLFTRLIASDTFAYKHLDFIFERGIHSLTGFNGASKSSLFATLLQGLFNKNPKVSKIDRVNNEITQQPYEIDIYFTKGEVPYRVLNSRKTGKITVWKGGYEDRHKISLVKIPDNLKLIEEILGCDYQMACDLMYQSVRSSLNLLETNSDGERKKFVNRILRMDELDLHLKRVEEKAKELGGKKGRIETLVAQIHRIEESFTEERAELPEADTEPTARNLAELNEQRDRLLKDVSKHAVELEVLQGKLDKAELQLSNLEAVNKMKFKLAELAIPEKCQAELQDELVELSTRDFSIQAQLLKQKQLLADNQRVQATQRKIDGLVAKLNSITPPDKTLEFAQGQKTRISTLKIQTKADLEHQRSELAKLKVSAEQGKCHACGHEVDVETVGVQIKGVTASIIEATELIDKCSNSLDKYNDMIATWEYIDSINRELEILKAQAGTPVDTTEIEREQQGLEQELAKVLSAIVETKAQQALHVERNLLHDRISKVQYDPELDADVLKYEVSQYTDVVVDLNNRLKSVNVHIKQLTEVLGEAVESNTQARIVRHMNSQIRENNVKLEEEKAALKSELAASETRLALLKNWSAILGSKGYRVHKIKRFLGTLNHTMANYADMISGGRIQCRFFIDEEGEIDFTVTDCNKSIDFEGWSDGEKARVRMACLFAVLELLETVGSISFNVLCLDEIFGALDDEGKTGLFNVLNYLRHQGKSIVTIAHSEIALDMIYDSRIVAQKLEDGTSTILQEAK